MGYPSEFGQPCWSPGQVRKVISLTAQTSTESAPYFLAAHSPFRRITDSKAAERTLTEEQVFHEIFSAARGQVQAFVKGEPGTGKSHLIRWLKLRAEYAAGHREAGLDAFKLVLVSRGNGSLKEALGQIVSQLGHAYEKHIQRVRGAIERLSEETARATLLAELALEIGTRWTNERGRVPLDRSLRHLGQSLRANGFGRWLTRDGGIVDQVIKRLTEQSRVEERETFPVFHPDELRVPPTFLRANENAEEVRDFGLDLEEEEATRKSAAEALNTALHDAIRGMTGLKGSDLLDIFVDIRRELGPKKSLAIFIEDVSVVGGLDQDIVNAFEPRGGDGLCRMVAVLGVTNYGWARMPDNQRQRGTHVFEVGGDVVAQWWGNRGEVAAFAARYLNAVRSSDEDIEVIAAERFATDVQRSKCDGCPKRERCHETFGRTVLPGGVAIGMFPFSESAPQALLTQLTEAYYKSQRDLLDRVLLPALDQSFGAFLTHEFPRPSTFSIAPRPLVAWPPFENRYCGGGAWDGERKARLRFLAQFWVEATSVEDLAAQLQPFLEPLGLPKFSAAPPKKTAPERTAAVGPIPAPAAPPLEDPELDHLLGLLDEWRSGKPLRQDNRFRDLLGTLLRLSIVWADQRGTPISEAKRLVTGNAFPRIEGQTTRPAAQNYFVPFERIPETYDLLHALVLFERQGRGSWDFPHGELYKSHVSRWLRKHRARVVDTLRPDPPALAEVATNSAIRTLALSALLRTRRQPPDGRADLVEYVLGKTWDAASRPRVLSGELSAVVSDLEQKHEGLREFVVRELGAGQGDAVPKDFIDPVRVLRAVEGFDRSLVIEPPAEAVDQSFWKSRFQAVSKLGAYRELANRLTREREALRQAVDEIRRFIRTAGCDDTDPREGLNKCVSELTDVIVLQRGGPRQRGILPLPNARFDQLWERKLIQDGPRREPWGVALATAVALAEQDDPCSLLAFDPTRLIEAMESLRVVEEHLDLIDKSIREEEDASGPGGDSRGQLLKELERLATITPGDDGEDVEA